ncbi:MAG: ribonuclease P protein component [Chloroflexi bacterium]|nr:ribonuclease P protein component [Chloroflexota bacterium]
MEPRARLRRASDIRLVFGEGDSWKHPLMVLVARPNGLELSRVGVTASRRIGGAVVRNRARRLMREAARQLYPHIISGYDLMLVARAGIRGAKEPRVEQALEYLLQEAQLMGSEVSVLDAAGIV